LVELVNQDPRRGTGHATSLTKIRFDDIALTCLAGQGMNAETVPVKGKRVNLRHNANLSTGGSATDVTDDVHPALAARAVAAAKMVGLDICGVDVVCESVHQPLEEQGGGVVEVNAAPGLRMHLSPSFGKGRPVGEAIINTMFKPGENGRIPVVADLAPHCTKRFARGHDQHRWRVHRRPPHRHRRLQRPQERAQCVATPRCGCGRAGNGAWRHAARRPGL
jgi:cyanophycin synthetase